MHHQVSSIMCRDVLRPSRSTVQAGMPGPLVEETAPGPMTCWPDNKEDKRQKDVVVSLAGSSGIEPDVGVEPTTLRCELP